MFDQNNYILSNDIFYKIKFIRIGKSVVTKYDNETAKIMELSITGGGFL